MEYQTDSKMTTKRKVIDTFVFPIALYGAEAYTLKSADIAKLVLICGTGGGSCEFHGLVHRNYNNKATISQVLCTCE